MDTTANVSVESFVAKTILLLEKERDAEISENRHLTEKLPAKELQRRGVCLLKLHIGNRKTGMFGRVVINFETHLEALPAHCFSPGDIVGLSHSQSDTLSESLGSGIVTRVSQSAVSVAFDDSQDLFSLDDGPTDYYKLSKLANDVTYKRLKRALNKLRKVQSESCCNLVSVLFGEHQLSPASEIKVIQFVNENLDESQREAVRFALTQKEVAVVHGPPGTGKTTTVIEIILQAVKNGNKVLACAPSNIAVDNLVERLAQSKHRIVRLGHPARLLPHIQKYSLDAILSTSEETRLVEDVRKDLDKTLSSLKKARDKGEKQRLREDMKHLRKELRQREDFATRDILKRADVVLVTLTSATDDGPMKLLEESHFDVTVIDEVSQAMEAACWIPLLRTKKCILAGDHLQLPPTILSVEAAKEGLEVTLMERVLALHGEPVMKMLTIQYRMNNKIMQWSSQELYECKLVAHVSVKEHLLKDLEDVEDNEVTNTPLLYIDTAGCDLWELDVPEEISKGNEGEADLVRVQVARLVSSGVKQVDIAVIAPYNLQVELIRLRLSKDFPNIEVKSVDGFQGREKEAVIISLVRSNPKGEVGFLSEKRRINVAVTRARRHLTVIGNSETVSKDAFLQSLIDYMNAEGEVHTAQQYIDEGMLQQTDVRRPEHLDDLISLAKSDSKGARTKTTKQTREKKQPSTKYNNNKADNKTETVKIQNDEINLEEERVVELQVELDKFVANKTAKLLEFPASLTNRDRFIIHELAEKLGLAHTSKGCGEERFIVVTKPGIALSNTAIASLVHCQNDDNVHHMDTNAGVAKSKKKKSHNDNENNVEVSKIDTKVHEHDEINNKVIANEEHSTGSTENIITETVPKNLVVCKICKKDVIKANIELHEIHCARKEKDSKQNQNIKSVNVAKSKDVSHSSTHRKFDKELACRVDKVDKDDIDALIETVKKVDSQCCFKKCKVSVHTLFQQCQHCEGRYCMSHFVPEVHGCGDAARAEARARISKDGVLHRGSGVPVRADDPVKKAHLHRKLDSKLTELASKRKTKK